MKHLRRNICVALLVLVAFLAGGIAVTCGVSFADGSGGQVPPPTGPVAVGSGWTILTYAVCTTSIMSSR